MSDGLKGQVQPFFLFHRWTQLIRQIHNLTILTGLFYRNMFKEIFTVEYLAKLAVILTVLELRHKVNR